MFLSTGAERRSDCTGSVYIQVHGGFLYKSPEDSLPNDGQLNQVCLQVALRESTAQIPMWGCSLHEKEFTYRQRMIQKGEDVGSRWFFGALASLCELGAACPKPEECKKCTANTRSSENIANAKEQHCGAMNRAGTGKGTVLATLLSQSPRWPFKRDGEDGCNATSSVTMAEPTRHKQKKAVFCAEERVLPVNEFFGRFPLSFEIGSMKHMLEQRRATAKKRSKGYAISSSKGVHSRSGLRTEIGIGTAYLADALSFNVTQTVTGRQQIIRLVDKGSQEPIGCLAIELCFLAASLSAPSSSEEILIHSAVQRRQLLLVQTVLRMLKRNTLSAVLTRRSAHHEDMNPYEIATTSQQGEMLKYLLGMTSNAAWNEWNASNPSPGRNALHFAVLSGDVQCLSILLEFFTSHDKARSSLIANLDQRFDLIGLEEFRSALTEQCTDRALSAKDKLGRTPFALACSLPQSQEAISLVKTLLDFEVDLSAVDANGNSPLMLAVLAEQRDVTFYLLSLMDDGAPGHRVCRAKPNMPNPKGYRVIHIAAERGDHVLVQALLEAGALPSLRNSDGALPIHLAAKHGHIQVIEALLDWPECYARMELRNQKRLVAAQVENQRRMLEQVQMAQDEPRSESSPTVASSRKPVTVSKQPFTRARKTISRPVSLLVMKMWQARPKADASGSSLLTEGAAVAKSFEHESAQEYSNENEQPDVANHSERPAVEALSILRGVGSLGYNGVSDEAIQIRQPGLTSIEWSSGHTAQTLAKLNGFHTLSAMLEERANVESQAGKAEASAATIQQGSTLPVHHSDTPIHSMNEPDLSCTDEQPSRFDGTTATDDGDSDDCEKEDEDEDEDENEDSDDGVDMDDLYDDDEEDLEYTFP